MITIRRSILSLAALALVLMTALVFFSNDASATVGGVYMSEDDFHQFDERARSGSPSSVDVQENVID